MKADKNVKLVDWNPLGNQYTFRPNHLHPPFNNPKVRQALWYAFNQKDFLEAVIGDPTYYKTCKAMFVCGSAMATDAGMDGLLESNFQKARDLLKEAGYDGTPVVLMHSTDLQVLTNLAPVAKSLMEKAGFKVDMQSMDWQTLVARRAKKDPPNAGGWNAFLTSWVSADILNPVMAGFANAGCDKAMFGWPCDAEMEKLRDQFARETDPAKQKEIAAAAQKRNTEVTTHLFLGQWYSAAAVRKNIDGHSDRAGAGVLERGEEEPVVTCAAREPDRGARRAHRRGHGFPSETCRRRARGPCDARRRTPTPGRCASRCTPTSRSSIRSGPRR